MEIENFDGKYNQAKDAYNYDEALELLGDRFGDGHVKEYFNQQGFYEKYQIVHNIAKVMEEITSLDYVSDSEFKSYYDWMGRFINSQHSYYRKLSEEEYYPIDWDDFDNAVRYFEKYGTEE